MASAQRCNNKDAVQHNWDNCRNWCLENGGCDAGVSAYCEANIHDGDFCSCYDANARQALPEKVRDLPIIKNNRAICYSTKCVSNGYLPKNARLLTESCPRCIQTISFDNISVDGGDAVFKNIKQQCNINSMTDLQNVYIIMGILVVIVLFLFSSMMIS